MVFPPFLHMPTLTLPCAMDGVMFILCLFLCFMFMFMCCVVVIFPSVDYWNYSCKRNRQSQHMSTYHFYSIRPWAQQCFISLSRADFTGRQQMCFQLLRWSCCWGTNTVNISSVCWYFPSSSSWVHKPASKWVRPSNTWALESPDTKAIVGRYQ